MNKSIYDRIKPETSYIDYRCRQNRCFWVSISEKDVGKEINPKEEFMLEVRDLLTSTSHNLVPLRSAEKRAA